MILWSALRRLLPLLAVLSLAFVPVAAPAAMAGLHAPMALAGQAGAVPHRDHVTAGDHAHTSAMSMAMADAAMPCCPPDDAAPPDRAADGPAKSPASCLKGCPLMALCLGGLAFLQPSGLFLPVRAVAATVAFVRREADFASVSGTPPPEPPRT